MIKKKYNESACIISLLIVLLFLVVLIYLRNHGLYPMVFSDELSYSKFSRIVPFSDASLPNYFYFFFYRITNLCGNGYLDCARIINLAFYLMSIPFIYLIGKATSSRRMSLFISVISFAGASNSYTAYFMPEAMYYLSFWIISWLALRIESEHGFLRWLTLGVAIGFASLIKPHALFLLPAIAVYAHYIISGDGLGNCKKSFIAITLIILTSILVKIMLGFALAGWSGVTMFGNFYAPYAESAVSSGLPHYIFMAKHTLFSLFGHFVSISLIYGVPLAVVINLFISCVLNGNNQIEKIDKLTVFTTLIISTLVLVSALYTASISATTPGNHLHVRYYFFALPLLFLVAASSVLGKSKSVIRKSIIAAPIAAAIIYVMITKLSGYEMYSSTAPELYGVVTNKAILMVISSISLTTLILWVLFERIGVAGYLMLFLPVMTACSLSVIDSELLKRKTPDVFDKAGVYSRVNLDQDERNSTVIIGDSAAVGGLFRTLFYLDTPNLKYLDVNSKYSEIFGIVPNSDFNLSKISADKKYLIVIGKHEIFGETKVVHCEEDFCIRQIVR
ncbi:glycosyltransferase family 39 protein [Pantoea ananatis]|uniref:glycosyltransferase family 39 protein n=1 Tax=Pantoea ananas TaxID=553 RepID=UPI001B305EB6|nr:glycosyltransferase family 39 protein [Pantoea ananatis]